MRRRGAFISVHAETIPLGKTNLASLNLTAIVSSIMAIALAACSSSNYNSAKDESDATLSEYRPLTTDYAPNFMARTSIGRVMTTPQGATIYTFAKDEIGKSNCVASCATQWLPIIAADGARPYGKMSLVRRDSGQQQWAYDGRPLYTYFQDEMHGDVKGENVGNVWHVIR
jgi:predicted lipoprotein with Yx(FWY)xxD motif